MRTFRSTIWFFALSTIVTLGALPIAAEGAKFDVDLKLILAVDVSDSMSREELQLQRKGYVSTFRDPSVARAIASGEIGRIAVLYLEWAGPDHLHVVRPWTVLATLEDTLTFADVLAMEPIPTDSSMSNRAMSFGKSLDQAPIATATATSISAGLLFARGKFRDRRFRGNRQVIDVSGNGTNNSGPPLAPVRDLLVSEGITINGLPIAWSTADNDDSVTSFGKSFLERYYDECVIGGPGAFSIVVNDISRFQEAVRLKLVTEIAEREILARPVSFEPAARAQVDCTVQEVDR
jgi:hypothetical protein